MNLEALRQHYYDSLGWLQGTVRHGLDGLLDGARKTFRFQYPQIAVPKAPECRVKEFAKIVEKISRKGGCWEHDAIFIRDKTGDILVPAHDMVGGRVVCATPADAIKFCEIVCSRTQQLKDIKRQEKTQANGYRALHVDAGLHVFDESGMPSVFPVEIQVKTLLQDAWANFGHDEFYKSAEPAPPISQEISRHLADVLAGLNNSADFRK